MGETTLLLQLIGDIYDAALDGSLWPRVLDSTCRYVGGACVALNAQDFVDAAECQLACGLDHDEADVTSRRRLEVLAPHFRRAVAIGRIIDLHKVEAAALADTLDGLATATFLVSGSGRIVHANLRGQELLSAATVLRASGGELEVIERKANRALKEVLAAAAVGDVGRGEKGTSLALATAGNAEWVAHILSLASGARRRTGICYPTTAAVFVRQAGLDLPSAVETLATAHRLTPAEVRVLLAFMETGGVQDVAAMLGISEPTVKTHLQRIFGKAGVKRQVDLVKLVASHMTPLAARRRERA